MFNENEIRGLRHFTNYIFKENVQLLRLKTNIKKCDLIPLYLEEGGAQECTVSLETQVLVLTQPVTSHVVGL